MSPDVAEKLVENKRLFINDSSHPDDVLMGNFVTKQLKIKPIPCGRIDLTTMNRWEQIKDSIPHEAFHFRLKNQEHLRTTDELHIYSQLINKFYNPTPKGSL